jgi:3D (Asp-Asp-Asp) domain-containing protein
MRSSPRLRAGLVAAGVLQLGLAVAVAPALASDPGPAEHSFTPMVASDPVELGLQPATTTTTMPPTVEAPASARPRNGAAARTVTSTGYCLDGTTADGGHTGPGEVAMNGVPLGSTWAVRSGPLAGRVLVVTDRIGHGSQFDVWFSTCSAARAYGRRTIEIVRTGSR